MPLTSSSPLPAYFRGIARLLGLVIMGLGSTLVAIDGPLYIPPRVLGFDLHWENKLDKLSVPPGVQKIIEEIKGPRKGELARQNPAPEVQKAVAQIKGHGVELQDKMFVSVKGIMFDAMSSVVAVAQNAKPLTPEVQKIVDQLKARGVKIQGEVALAINGQTVILNQNGVQAPGATAAQVSGQATLRWRNGEKLVGDLAGVKDGTLLWRSPLFTEPLTLDMAALQDADFPPATKLSEEPFVVKLRDGGRLFGTPVSLDADLLKLRSARHGEISLRLAEVVSLQRTHGAGLLYHGPDTAAGWRLPSGSSGKMEWRTQEGGTFGTTAWNRSARLDLDLPSKVDVLLRVSADASPAEFTFSVGGGVDPPLTVEFWSGTVVLAQGNRFVPLKSVNDGFFSFSVRLLWDRTEGHAFAFSPEGELLGELKPAVTKGTTAVSQGKSGSSTFHGVQIRNNGLDLTLDELRVREWKGEMPGRIKLTDAGVELTNGKTLQGKVTALSDGRITLGSGAEVALEDLEAFSTGATPAAASGPSPAAILAFEDGTRLVGNLQSVNDGSASMQIGASAVAISAPTAGLQRIHLDVPAAAGSPPEPPFAKQDKVVLGKVTLHGRVTGAGEAEPRWLPVGGRTPVAIASESLPVFTRAFTPDAVPLPPALVYLENGDVLPGEVRAMDATSLHIASPLSEVQELPAAQVQAVQFGGRKLQLKGFSDPGWRQVRGAASSLQQDASKILFRQPASFAHPNILQGDEVKFVLTAEDGWGALRVRVFTSGGDEPEGGFALLLYLSGNELYGGLESERGGDFANQVQIRTAPNQPVNIRLALQEKQVELFANGVSICKASATPNPKDAAAQQRMIALGRGRGQPAKTTILGPGLVFETVSIWGNGEQPVGVRDFSVRPNPMRPWMPAIDPKAKEQTLTLPRFRTDDPPTHVLVALNGDVLRGRLEAATAEHLRVTSGLEALTVPRDRVAAVIRLQPPDKVVPPSSKTDFPDRPKPAPARPATTHWILLTDGGRFGLNVERFDADKIIGRSTLLGRCEVPWERVNTVRYTAPEPTTAQASYRDWKLQAAPEPVLPEGQGGSQSSPLIGKEVKDFKVPMLAGGEFDFAKQRGKIVILDFWATWCGPCIQSLPELMEAVESLKADKAVADKLVFVAMDQAEGAPQIKRFLEQRSWKLPVGLDLLQNVGRQFQVEGIPHTVIIGPDGKIAWTNTGARPGAAKELAEMVKKLAAVMKASATADPTPSVVVPPVVAAPETRPVPAPDAVVVPVGDLVEITPAYPKPMFIGTPVPTGDISNLEKPDPEAVKARLTFKAPKGTENVAKGKKVTSSDTLPIIGTLDLVTDGDADGSDGCYVELAPGHQWIQIDLGAECKIWQILAWHFHKQSAVYFDVNVCISNDPEFKKNVVSLFNNDDDDSAKLGKGNDPTYVETNHGRLIDGKGVKGRYVRLYSNGNTANEMNHYIEVQVYGTPVTK